MQNTYEIFGIRSILEAIKAGKTIDKVFLQKGLKGELISELEAIVKEHHLNVSYVPVEKLNRLSKKNHQGAVATLSPIEFYEMEDLVLSVTESGKNPLFLLLDQLSDVRNFGAIIRTAECTGVNGIIIQKKGAAPVTADTVKTSAGAVFNIPIAKVDHLKDAVYYLQASGIKVLGISEKTANTIYSSNLTVPLALVMGAEDVGISPSVLKAVDDKVKLPMFGSIGSLNVSVACGACLYEVVRQRGENY